jgi:hypothetical protein
LKVRVRDPATNDPVGKPSCTSSRAEGSLISRPQRTTARAVLFESLDKKELRNFVLQSR